MREEVVRLEDQLRRAFEGEAWHGPEAGRWREAVEDLRRLNRGVPQAMLSISAERLDQMLAPGHTSAYMHFAGLAQHDAYHAGQITLLRKALPKR